MRIDDELIMYLENLSKLELTPREREQAKTELGAFIGCLSKLSEVDTQGLPALSHPFGVVNRFRDDVVELSLPRELVLRGAPENDEQCYQVPQTIE
ncbi:MAG: Asp-tRNA(Asn)/Glu-tRNA(Gln) amidotransferase subunit GatC [Oscillospiraceae bacterium]|nr:Asp-tRNA(Asn)/Glu-tRNA(Gln) amidotransferase subunit GatC [Oscillospiraceae bacterium]